jgi:hypothetical protein
VRDDDEEMPQPPTELPSGWKPGDMLPPEEDGGQNMQDWRSIYRGAESQADDQERPSGGLLARAGLSEPAIESRAQADDDGGSGYSGQNSSGDPQSPKDEEAAVDSEGSGENDTYPKGRSEAGTPIAKVATKIDPLLGPQTIYGETAGLYPKKKNLKGSTYDPRNWDADSEKQLREARQIIAEVQSRNDVIKKSSPTGDNPIEQRQWKNAQDAATAAGNTSPKEVGKMWMLQKNVGPQKPPASWNDWTLYKRYGPFENVGGGDVPRGHETYIEFYQRPQKK